MTEEAVHLVERLHTEGEKTVAFFRALEPIDWGKQVYSEGAQWTVQQVLAHLVSAEASVTRLIQHIVDGGPGVPEDFDLNAYNERKVAELEGLGPADLLERFTALREQTAEMVTRLSQADLERIGRHPFLGMARVADIVKLMYRHNQIHQRELRKALGRRPLRGPRV